MNNRHFKRILTNLTWLVTVSLCILYKSLNNVFHFLFFFSNISSKVQVFSWETLAKSSIGFHCSSCGCISFAWSIHFDVDAIWAIFRSWYYSHTNQQGKNSINLNICRDFTLLNNMQPNSSNRREIHASMWLMFSWTCVSSIRKAKIQVQLKLCGKIRWNPREATKE